MSEPMHNQRGRNRNAKYEQCRAGRPGGKHGEESLHTLSLRAANSPGNLFGRGLRLFFWSIILSLPAFALNPDRRISQYSHSAWRTQDGFFNGAPNAITQTADGYLWIGTQAGLMRFRRSSLHGIPTAAKQASPLLNDGIAPWWTRRKFMDRYRRLSGALEGRRPGELPGSARRNQFNTRRPRRNGVDLAFEILRMLLARYATPREPISIATDRLKECRSGSLVR